MSDALIPGASDYDGISEYAMRWTPEDQHSHADALTELLHRRRSLGGGPGRTAREAGFTVPIALTAAAWADCVQWSDEASNRQTPRTRPAACGTS